MSYQAVQWALYLAPMIITAAGHPDSTSRLVLVALAERADDQGRRSYPGRTSLIEATGLDERTIQRAESRLEKAGLIIRRGISQYGTTVWDMDMSRTRDTTTTTDARIAHRRAMDAARQARRRARLKERP